MKTYKPNDTARIEAMLFTSASHVAAKKWAKDEIQVASKPAKVKTLEGWVDMPIGSYLIRGTSGEFYPCDPDIFEKRWVEVV